MTGSQTERDLATALDTCGWSVMRAPASGAGTARDMPDVLAGRPNRPTLSQTAPTPREVIAIELKATSGTTAYVDAEEVDALERFATGFGARAMLAVKFKGQGTRTKIWLVPPENARVTDTGTHGLPESDIEARAVKVVLPETGTKRAEVRDV